MPHFDEETSSRAGNAAAGKAGEEGEGGLSSSNIYAAIKESIQTSFGDFGSGVTLYNLQARCYDPVSRTCIIRASREGYCMVKAAIAFVSSLQGLDYSLTVERSAGSARTCAVAALSVCANQYARLGIHESRRAGLLAKRKVELELI